MMTTNQLLTWGAVAFAVYAVVTINKMPGKAAAIAPGQQQRDLGLGIWLQGQALNYDQLTNQSNGILDGSSLTLNGWVKP